MKMTEEQTMFNQQIEELFEVNQHEKAWNLFEEMSKHENSKPNLLTYQLLFKNVRMTNEVCPFEEQAAG